MITKEEIQNYIDRVPPIPENLKECLEYLDKKDLVKAAKSASKDMALSSYLVNHINKPIYGFRGELTNISQIFGALGVAKSQQLVYSYMVSLLSPKKWKFFNLNEISFYNLQAELTVLWHKILKELKIQERDLYNAVAILPASIIVCEALFVDREKEVQLLRSVHDIDLNTILKRLCGMDLFDVSKEIAKRWNMSLKVQMLIEASSGLKYTEDKEIEKFGKWMHLLLFFLFSKPVYIKAGLNDFINFNIEYVDDIYEEFMRIMDIS